MAKTATAPVDLRKKDRVVATTALRDVPEGSTGRVAMVSGLTWIRYWVRFDSGVSVGSIPRAKLATPDEWERRHEIAEELSESGDSDGDGAASSGGDGGDDDGGGVTTPSGTLIPQKFIERAAAARARLAG